MSFARFTSCNLVGCLAVAALVLPAFASASLVVQHIDADVSDALLNPGWTYYELAVTDPAQLKDAGEPVPVDLPHTWNATDSVDTEPGYRRDAAWYQKFLTIDEGSTGQRYKLYFEGANMTASVYVNGEHAGGQLVQDHGTPDKSAVIELANGRAGILFDPQGKGAGAIIEVRTQSLKGSWISLP